MTRPVSPYLLGETASLIQRFVNSRARTTVGEVAGEFALDPKQASQQLRRLWNRGMIGKRARGVFEPAPVSPSGCDDMENNAESEDRDDIEYRDDTALIEDTADSEDSAEGENSEETGDSEHCAETGDSEHCAETPKTARGQRSTALNDNPDHTTSRWCPAHGSPLGESTGKCLDCILERARAHTAETATAP